MESELSVVYSYEILITSQIVDVQSLTEAGFLLEFAFLQKIKGDAHGSCMLHQLLTHWNPNADREQTGNRSEPWE